MLDTKKKIVLIFLSILMIFTLFQSCSMSETETGTETIETESICTIEESTEVVIETTEEILPEYMDTAIVAAEMASRYKMIGRLIIPSVGVDVALFDRYTQATVDNKDSAGTYRYNGGQMVIADHKNQGFAEMKSSIPNVTIAYINDGQVVTPYICVDNNVGRNKATGVPYDLLDCNGNSIYLQNAGGICMYTCNEHWSSITYTYWQPIS